MQTLPVFIVFEVRIMGSHVSAIDPAQEGRQAPSVLERGGESPSEWRARAATACAVSGGNQIQAAARPGLASERIYGAMRSAVGFRNISVHEYRKLNWMIVHRIALDHAEISEPSPRNWLRQGWWKSEAAICISDASVLLCYFKKSQRHPGRTARQ